MSPRKKSPTPRILPARFLRFLPYVLSAGLAMLFLLVWFRFQGLEEERKQRELQRAASDASRIVQQRITLYGNYLLAAESLVNASTSVTKADWNHFLNTLKVSEDPALLDFGIGSISEKGMSFRLARSRTGTWPAARADLERLLSTDGLPVPVVLLENGPERNLQILRLMDGGGIAALRIDVDLLFDSMRADLPEGARVQLFLPTPSRERLGPGGQGLTPRWIPITPGVPEQGTKILYHGPYFRYVVQADQTFFNLHTGAGLGLFQLFFLGGGLFLAFLLALLFVQQARQRQKSVDLAKRLARAFRISRSRQAQVFRKNRTVQLLLEPESGQIVDANEAASHYYGYTREELLDMTVFDINTYTREEILSAMERARASGQNHFNFRHRLKNGEIRDVEVYSGPLEFHGKPYLYSIVLDITLRKQLERELIQAKEAAQSASNAKSSFLLNMNHEIRTPLNSLLGMAELLEETELHPDQREYLQVMRKSSAAMLGIIENVLDASRIASGKLVLESAPFRVGALLEKVRSVMLPAAREKKLELN
ncbi:MAG: PAS domain S-box protein, partial [Leptospiraceae bacterium]|nr:PAS domain S-box protein [Leptospiraceae bacterium]